MCFLGFVYHFYVIKFKWKKYLWLKDQSRQGIQTVRSQNLLAKLWKRVKDYYNSFEDKHYMTIKRYTSSKTLEHFLLMAVVGWFIGTVLTVFHFYNSVRRGDSDVFWCFVIRVPLLIFITVSIAFTETGRCVLMLVPVQLCSTSGQVYIYGFILVLVTTGPLMNLKHNMDVMQETSSCQQKGVEDAAAEIADILFGPFDTFKQAAMVIVNGIKTMVAKLQAILATFKRTVMTVAGAIQNATKWINSKINGCKNTVGTTYQHCMNAFQSMYQECKVSIPFLMAMCSVSDFASNLCKSIKPGEYLCDLVFFDVDNLMTSVSQRISRLLNRAYTLMYFSVNIHHEFHVDSNRKTVMADIKERIKSSLLGLFEINSFASVLQFWMFLFNFVFLWRVFRYRMRYLQRDHFDNYYLSRRLEDIDHLEATSGRESIYPLKRAEKAKYIKVFTCRVMMQEQKDVGFPTFVAVKTILFLGIIALDYLLFFIADKCRTFMLKIMETFSSRTEISIEGSGFMGELGRRVVRALNYVDYNFYQAHFMPCIPNPRPPNAWTNYTIYVLLAVLWISALLRPFVLRLRHAIMDYYHPDVADRRARWLYNHILFKRMTFTKLIGVKLRGKYGHEKQNTGFSIADFLRAKYPCTTLFIGKGTIGSYCKICQHVVPPLFSCPTKDCPGIYCDDCYLNIQGVCSICRQAMMVAGLEDKLLNVKKVLPDRDEIDITDQRESAEGFFKIIEDEVDLDFSYQDQFRSCSEPEAGGTQTVQYCVGDEDKNQSPFKYKKLKESKRKTHLSYEEMFEMV